MATSNSLTRFLKSVSSAEVKVPTRTIVRLSVDERKQETMFEKKIKIIVVFHNGAKRFASLLISA